MCEAPLPAGYPGLKVLKGMKEITKKTCGCAVCAENVMRAAQVLPHIFNVSIAWMQSVFLKNAGGNGHTSSCFVEGFTFFDGTYLTHTHRRYLEYKSRLSHSLCDAEIYVEGKMQQAPPAAFEPGTCFELLQNTSYIQYLIRFFFSLNRYFYTHIHLCVCVWLESTSIT